MSFCGACHIECKNCRKSFRYDNKCLVREGPLAIRYHCPPDRQLRRRAVQEHLDFIRGQESPTKAVCTTCGHPCATCAISNMDTGTISTPEVITLD